MPELQNTLYNLRQLEDLARGETWVHSLHPLVKLLATLCYIVVVVSFQRDEILMLLPLFLYPWLMLALGEIPTGPILRKLILVSPFVISIGIMNPIFDRAPVEVAGITLAHGWLTFGSILIKSGLTVSASLLLIATSGLDQLAQSLRMLKVPKIFVLQLLLTYRYLSVLLEELARMLRAYGLRAPGQRGVRREAWGPFVGQLLLRTMDRAQRVYQAMVLRGFSGEYHPGRIPRMSARDLTYLTLWILYFLLARFFPLSYLLGTLMTGR